ncbi:uncharacterized protein F21D5.5 [Cloeon dipterum]|uniref:uncharacterized protein F21D5.5 n=1 Tax=Cloeon dipterum TaxID=197152 RepID=UPI00321F68E9
MGKKCYIKCVEDSHDPILLPDGKEVPIGRAPETKIQNKRCSRKQVSFTANYKENTVLAKQLGDNPSILEGGIQLFKGETRLLCHEDSIELIEGFFKHRIVFEPPPMKRAAAQGATPDEVDATQPKKARMESLMRNGLSGGKWETVDQGKMLVFSPHGMNHSSKVASYDLDWTLIGTKSGRVYPRDADDWQILLPEIPGKLKKFHADGYKLVIFSNQAGIGTHRIVISEFQRKVENIARKLGVPIQAFISTGTSIYRKPLTGMWKYLSEQNDGVPISISDSFYCGDAAGRPEKWAPKKKKDFSCSDRLFAMNIGIEFFTPEEHFQGQTAAPFSLPNFQPLQLSANDPLVDPPTAKLEVSEPELVVMVGGPGSGKSTFARQHLSSYTYVNMDQLKSVQKCIQEVKKTLDRRASVVVDNTNPDKKARARFLAIAKQTGVKSRCFKMLTSKEHCRHNIRFRELTDSSHAPISEMIVRQYEKNYEEPALDEGFVEIIGVNFVPRFEIKEHEKLYNQFLP